ncbi:hypothetical protein [Paenibacillus humicus]|uniref:hypothetical protein n=1 Tax=Paenibacillus humicus TaxID=412861 RepID=UPI003D2E96A2
MKSNKGNNMNFKSIFIFLILIMISTGCGKGQFIEVKYSIEKMPGGNFQETVNGYFHNFDDIRKWRIYATDSYVKRVYSWCTGDYSEEETINEMVKIYYELNKHSLQLKSVDITKIETSENNDVTISVMRTWENDQTDETNYFILLDNNEWKIDDRF